MHLDPHHALTNNCASNCPKSRSSKLFTSGAIVFPNKVAAQSDYSGSYSKLAFLGVNCFCLVCGDLEWMSLILGVSPKTLVPTCDIGTSNHMSPSLASEKNQILFPQR